MSVINHIIKQAKAQPDCIYINSNQVRSIAEHMRLSMFNPDKQDIDFFVKALESGTAKIMNIPIKVLGLAQPAPRPAQPCPAK